MKWTTAKTYVLRHNPDAECLTFTNKYQGVETLWYIICCDFYRPHDRVHHVEIGASSKCEELAWISAADTVKNTVQEEMLRKLEK